MNKDDKEKGSLIRRFSKIQSGLLPEVKLENNFQMEQIQLIAGIDLAYWNINKTTYAVCCIAVIDYYTKNVVEKVYSEGEITIPYIPGFLAFRELPLMAGAAKKLRTQPDLYMFDGNGYLHDRHMGLATHASIYLNKPSIGVAKSYLKVRNVDFVMPKNIKGAYTDIIINHEVYGRALRTRKDVKPIFVSCGNWITLKTATEIVMNLVDHDSRLPIPTRFADLYTHEMRRKLKNH